MLQAMRPLASSAVLFWLTLSPLQAQSPASRVGPGDRVEFRLRANRSIVAGRVVTISADSLWLKSNREASTVFARTEIAQLWRRLPGSSGAGSGALVGLVLGTGLGALWGHMACQAVCEGGESGTGFVLIYGATFGGLGALTGAIAGAIASPVRWTVGTWPVRQGIGVGVSIRI